MADPSTLLIDIRYSPGSRWQPQWDTRALQAALGDRWVGLQGIDLETLIVTERLQDAPRSGTPPKFTADQRCQMAALACEAPTKAGRPISQWTGREIAEELMARDIVEQISPRHASYLLKKGARPPQRFRYWLNEVPDAQRDAKIRDGCEVYAGAPERAKSGERTISMDELTGVQAAYAQTSRFAHATRTGAATRRASTSGMARYPGLLISMW